jgi:eukaryotic-like serine/threonine-protein kinase
MVKAKDEALVGRTIADKFVLESFIGGGAMGAVYRAKQLSLDKAVAIKVLRSDLVTDPTFVARFQREAKAASRLDHRNSVRVLDYGRDSDGLCYIAMELLVGRSLFQILREAKGPLEPERTVQLTRQILAPLAMAHEMGIVHRDLKPENIIVVGAKGDDGEVIETLKVCDFGMAKILQATSVIDTFAEKLTSRGSVLGTPEYMSPEQGRGGEELDARSDLYSVGVILYQMLTGKLPFVGDTPVATLLKHIVEQPRRPSELVPDVPPALEAICLRALMKAPADRYASAREMRNALRGAQGSLARASHAEFSAEEIAPASDAPLVAQDDFRRNDSESRLAANGDVRNDDRNASSDSRRIVLSAGGASASPGGASASLGGASAPLGTVRRRALAALESESPPPQRGRVLGLFALGLGVAGLVGFFVLRGPGSGSAPSASPAMAPSAPSTPPPAPNPEPLPGVPERVAAPPPAETVSPTSTSPPVTPASGRKAPAPIASSAGARPASSSAPAGVPSAAPRTAPPPNEPKAEAPPAAAGTPYDKATVSMGAVRSRGAQGADVLAALPSGRMNQCYRDGLKAHGGGLHGSGTLRLIFSGGGHVSEAAFSGPSEFQAVGQCIAGSVTGINVRNVEPGAEGAEIDLGFNPE